MSLRQAELSDDLLEGAEAIAMFMYGHKDKARRVYYLIEPRKGGKRVKNAPPIARVGSTLVVRKSTLLRWIEEQERLAAGAE